jgi:hypothetical protein
LRAGVHYALGLGGQVADDEHGQRDLGLHDRHQSVLAVDEVAGDVELDRLAGELPASGSHVAGVLRDGRGGHVPVLEVLAEPP